MSLKTALLVAITGQAIVVADWFLPFFGLSLRPYSSFVDTGGLLLLLITLYARQQPAEEDSR